MRDSYSILIERKSIKLSRESGINFFDNRFTNHGIFFAVGVLLRTVGAWRFLVRHLGATVDI
ncbi:MAG: hypothetical protein CMF25_01240 [Kangiellaceae bacterium]|jgi:hypothetical protein|nr:hypothetical protein [Kangiellaceae bacterium]